MIFRKSKKTVKQGIGGMDKLITGIIIGWAAASIFWFSRTKKGKKFWERTLDAGTDIAKKWVGIFGKISVKFLSFLNKK